MTIQSLDGTVHPLFTGGSVTGTIWGTCSNTNLSLNVESTPVDSVTATHFFLADHLGTAQMEFAAGGWPVWQGQFAPFGGELRSGVPVAADQPDPTTANHYKFTGKERDTESGLDYFGARYYGSNMGRFMSPDPLEPATASKMVFTQVLMYPQDWNRYSYALNNPIAYKDETGNFTGRDHQAIEIAALTASGYSLKAAARAAVADAKMDNFHNMLSGVMFTDMFFDGSENPQHGERNGNESIAQANQEALDFENSKLDAATSAALAGNVGAALDDIGQASHTTQDVVRHGFEVSSDHPWSEPPATAAEKQKAIEKTQKILGKFETKVRTAAAAAGLNADQTNAIIKKVKDGPQ